LCELGSGFFVGFFNRFQTDFAEWLVYPLLVNKQSTLLLVVGPT